MQVRESPAFDFLMAAPRVLKSANKTNGPGSVRRVPCCPSIIRRLLWLFQGIPSAIREWLPNYDSANNMLPASEGALLGSYYEHEKEERRLLKQNPLPVE
jgi:hypothetical protein